MSKPKRGITAFSDHSRTMALGRKPKPMFEARYNRNSREWGTYATARLWYVVDCEASPDHGKRQELREGFYMGAGGREREYADAWAAKLNASGDYHFVKEPAQ